MDAIIVISDTHIGSYFGLCPSTGLKLDGGGTITQINFQKLTWSFWEDFWGKWVPNVTHGAKKIAVVHNGDIIDGNHHEAVDLIPNVSSQELAAVEVMKPIIKQYKNFYMIRGTEAHGGIGEQSTERIANYLGAAYDETTEAHSRQELWLEKHGVINQFAHHIGGTSSAAYETSAPMRELVATLIESAQWGRTLPNIVWRSHRHRYVYVPIPTANDSDITLVVTPGWQLKTTFVMRGDRVRMPHIGGVVALLEEGQWQIKKKLYPLPQPQTETF